MIEGKLTKKPNIKRKVYMNYVIQSTQMKNIRIYIATGKSRKIIRDAKIAEKKGQVVDWNKVLNDSHDARAIGRENQVRAVGEKK